MQDATAIYCFCVIFVLQYVDDEMIMIFVFMRIFQRDFFGSIHCTDIGGVKLEVI